MGKPNAGKLHKEALSAYKRAAGSGNDTISRELEKALKNFTEQALKEQPYDAAKQAVKKAIDTLAETGGFKQSMLLAFEAYQNVVFAEVRQHVR
ncbi:MAG: hypothetical protein ACN2B6_05140 [Rickettsiales bacterium]